VTDPFDGERSVDDLAELIHELRQPLSTLMLLVENAQQLDLSTEAAAVVENIAAQVAEAVAVARKISRLVD
jgi:signal transduction histidine kinase